MAAAGWRCGRGEAQQAATETGGATRGAEARRPEVGGVGTRVAGSIPGARATSIRSAKGSDAGASAAAIVAALVITLGGGRSDTAGLVDLPDYLNPNGESVSVRNGALAPDFELVNNDGSRFRLSD